MSKHPLRFRTSNLIGSVVHVALIYGGALAMLPTKVLANPTGGQVVAGSANIAPSGASTLNVNQTTQKAIINWQSFNISLGETTQFNQPNASAITLNRINGGDPSQILGNLKANGQVWLINPNGIVFGRSAKVDVAGLLATTIEITNSNFMAGTYRFDGLKNSGAMVVNNGQITVSNAGLAALVAPGVENSGMIEANLGQIQLSSAAAFTVDLFGDGLFNFTLDKQVTQAITRPDGSKPTAAVSNSGSLIVDGGRIALTANAASSVVSHSINLSGYAQATTATVANGVISLDGGTDGTVEVAGTINASGSQAGQTGGAVNVTGHNVLLDPTAKIDVSGDSGGGTALIGGDMHGGGTLRRASTTTIAAGASIKADATKAGDGGEVVVWSDTQTTFAGTISAKGGVTGGNGGASEVSSHGVLNFTGTVDLLAPLGTAGSLLLDPENVTIEDSGSQSIGSSSTGGQTTLSGSSDNSILLVSTLETALALGNVTVTTGSPSTGTQAGDITVASSVTWSTDNSLTLSAYRNIFVNYNVTLLNVGAGDLNLRADNTGTGIGVVFLNGSSPANPHANLDMSQSTGHLSIFYDPTNVDTPVVESGTFSGVVSAGADTTGFFGTAGASLIGNTVTGTYTFDSGKLKASSGLAGDAESCCATSSGAVSITETINGISFTATSDTNFAQVNIIPVPTQGFDTVYNISAVQMAGGPAEVAASFLIQRNSVDGPLPFLTQTGFVQNFNASNVQTLATSGAPGYASVAGQFSYQFRLDQISATNVSVGPEVNSTSYTKPTNFSYAIATNPAVSNQFTAYMLVNNVSDLQNMQNNLSGNYALGRNIDASATASWNSGAGFTPIGDYAQPFSGRLDGQGRAISGLTINKTSAVLFNSFVGLFGDLSGTVDDLSLLNVEITGTGVADVGGLVGFNEGVVDHVTVSGAVSLVSSSGYVGGLVGDNYGTVSNSAADVSVTGDDFGSYVGGLAGASGGAIINSHSAGNVSGFSVAGGLAAWVIGTVESSYATGSVTVGDQAEAGGLVGEALIGSSISDSYATGNVTGGNEGDVGGLVAVNGGTINKSFATGNVSAGSDSSAGGLAGYNCGASFSSACTDGTIENSYTRGAVSAGANSIVGGVVAWNVAGAISHVYSTGVASGGISSYVGGIAGRNGEAAYSIGGSISSAYWDAQTSGIAVDIGLNQAGPQDTHGLSTAQMKAGLPSDFDTSIWTISPNVNGGYPFLKWQTPTLSAIPLNWSVANSTSTYGTLGNTGAVTLTGVASGDVGLVNPVVGLFNGTTPVALTATLSAGTYTEEVVGLTGSQAGKYSLATTGNIVGTYVVDPKTLNWAVPNVGSVFGSTPVLGSSLLLGVVGIDSVSGTVRAFSGSHQIALGPLTPVGNYSEVVTGLTGLAAGNYVLAPIGNVPGTLAIRYSVAELASFQQLGLAPASLIIVQVQPSPPNTEGLTPSGTSQLVSLSLLSTDQAHCVKGVMAGCAQWISQELIQYGASDVLAGTVSGMYADVLSHLPASFIGAFSTDEFQQEMLVALNKQMKSVGNIKTAAPYFVANVVLDALIDAGNKYISTHYSPEVGEVLAYSVHVAVDTVETASNLKCKTSACWYAAATVSLTANTALEMSKAVVSYMSLLGESQTFSDSLITKGLGIAELLALATEHQQNNDAIVAKKDTDLAYASMNDTAANLKGLSSSFTWGAYDDVSNQWSIIELLVKAKDAQFEAKPADSSAFVNQAIAEAKSMDKSKLFGTPFLNFEKKVAALYGVKG